jgi:glycosyltransferase involved in cell wall biosynthesis
VAFDTTACGELVREGETGYLAELANGDSLLDALERALKAGDDNPFSKACRELIVGKCDVNKVGKQHLNIIMSSLGK